MISLTPAVWDFVKRHAKAPNVWLDRVHTEPGNAAPQYQTCCLGHPCVTVGEEWLAAQFPVKWAVMRLTGSKILAVTEDEVDQVYRKNLLGSLRG